MRDGQRCGWDHGVSLPAEDKLRTVLWGWAGEPLTNDEVVVLADLRAAVLGSLGETLAEPLTHREVDALARRCARLAEHGVLPHPQGDYPAIPWPPF